MFRNGATNINFDWVDFYSAEETFSNDKNRHFLLCTPLITH